MPSLPHNHQHNRVSLRSTWYSGKEAGLLAATHDVFAKLKMRKSPVLSNRAFSKWRLAVTYSHMGTPTLPSAQLRFTSEFGKGSGGSTALLPPSNNWYLTMTYSHMDSLLELGPHYHRRNGVPLLGLSKEWHGTLWGHSAIVIRQKLNLD